MPFIGPELAPGEAGVGWAVPTKGTKTHIKTTSAITEKLFFLIIDFPLFELDSGKWWF